MAAASVPDLDQELRLRLGRRFGSAIDTWFDGLPAVLSDLAEHAKDVETIAGRAEQLAPAVGADASLVLDWCGAFAGMVALEMAEASDGAHEQIEPLVALASRA